MKVIVLNMFVPEEEGSIKAYADVLFGNKIRVHGLKLVKSKDKEEFFLGMPSRKRTDKDTYEDVCEIVGHDFRAKVLKTIQEAYNARKSPNPPCGI